MENKKSIKETIIELVKAAWPIIIPYLIYLIIIIILWILQPDWIPKEFWEARNTTDFDPIKRW